MTGKLEDINSTFKPGETSQFDKEMFWDSRDQNVNKPIDFDDDLENLMNSLANINALTENELEEVKADED